MSLGAIFDYLGEKGKDVAANISNQNASAEPGLTGVQTPNNLANHATEASNKFANAGVAGQQARNIAADEQAQQVANNLPDNLHPSAKDTELLNSSVKDVAAKAGEGLQNVVDYTIKAGSKDNLGKLTPEGSTAKLVDLVGNTIDKITASDIKRLDAFGLDNKIDSGTLSNKSLVKARDAIRAWGSKPFWNDPKRLANNKELELEARIENLGDANIKAGARPLDSADIALQDYRIKELEKAVAEQATNAPAEPASTSANNNKVATKTLETALAEPLPVQKKGLGGIFGYLASKSGGGVDAGINKDKKSQDAQAKFEDAYNGERIAQFTKFGSNLMQDVGATLAQQSGKSPGQMVGNIFVPNSGVNWSSMPANTQARQAMGNAKVAAEANAQQQEFDNAVKEAELSLKSRGVDLEEKKIENTSGVKQADKVASADAIKSINAMQQAIYNNRDYYGKGWGKSATRFFKDAAGTSGAQLDADIAQRFKPVALDLLKNFKGAISEGEREFLMNFVRGSEVSPQTLIDTLNDVARKIAVQSGNDFKDFDYGQAVASTKEFKKVG